MYLQAALGVCSRADSGICLYVVHVCNITCMSGFSTTLLDQRHSLVHPRLIRYDD